MLVFTNGCFDILHAGHVAYLEQSRALGKYLVVGLNSDASVRRLKGGTRPINSQEDRKKVLLALRAVDAVYIFDEDTPYGLIKRVKPDIITKGGDYREQEVVGHDLAKVVILPYVDGKSTTGVINACSREGLGSRTDLVGRGRVLWEGLGL
jgi:D-beta-D-heptose 7-phosphate kinase/D-beta-D-heptose 1-phosphate adenosyltransferase